jgi:iron complex transport system substrate-binding protein
MKHALGSTTIKSQPHRVVTWGYGATDAALALGVVPVAIDYDSYGGDSHGVTPWVAQKLKAMHVPTPTVLPKSPNDPPYEAIARAHPDLILALSSGITAPQYALLSKIAPTVGYTGRPWTTPWQDVIRQTATALGRTSQATTVLRDIHQQLAVTAAAHPELKGKTVAAVWDVGGKFYVYRPADARVGFMLELGLVNAPSVDQLANGNESYYYTLSYEKVNQLNSDIVVVYDDTKAQLTTFLQSSYGKSMPAVRTGAVAAVVGTQAVAAVSPPTALSLPWGLPSLVLQLSAAATKAGAAR